MHLDENAFWQDEEVRLFLLEPDAVDDAYVAWLNDPAVNRHLESRFAAHSLESTRDYVSAIRDSSCSVMFGIWSKPLGRHVGNIKLGPIDWRHGLGEIGLMIGDRSAWGHGIATRAIALVTAIAREQLGLRKITAGCYASNAGSRIAFERAGFAVEGARKDHFLLDGQPEDLVLLAHLQNPANAPSHIRDSRHMRTFAASQAMLARAERFIPLGSQTFSKSRTQFPVGASPLFLECGEGSRVWDVDGNEYIDFVSSLGAITLGYQDPDVTGAVREQLDAGVILSLPHRLETEVAELICEMVPCAEKVRFGKNGSDATSGAVRIARASTGRDHVAVCGYHGWQDWYIGSTVRNRGVPQATRDLTHGFLYNDLASLETLFAQRKGEIAAVILEPMNVEWPVPGFLDGVRDVCTREGAVLIFDETITGFRYANGGAQALFGVTPDLATFGKGLANGYPVSAIAGRADIMKQMEEVFFSFTFGGEMLSLAAAKATLRKLKRVPVLETIARHGQSILDRLPGLIEANGLDDTLAVRGHPSWTFLTIQDHPAADAFAIKTLFMQEMHQQGLISVGTHNLSYAHGSAELEALFAAYEEFLPLLRKALDGDFATFLRTAPLVPLFKVR